MQPYVFQFSPNPIAINGDSLKAKIRQESMNENQIKIILLLLLSRTRIRVIKRCVTIDA